MNHAPMITTLATDEPTTTAIILAGFGVLIAVSVLFSGTVNKLGLPVVLLFLILGMFGGSEGVLGIDFSDYQLAMRIGTVALILILFDGGLNTSMQAVRAVFWPATALATVGVAMTAGLVAVVARLLGLGWTESLLLGAVVSSTDAAAVFAVLRGGGLNLSQRIGQTVEVESCINDPMAIILTMSLIEVMLASAGGGVAWSLLWSVPTQLVVGSVVGYLFGRLALFTLAHARLPTVGLYPALTLATAFASFGFATVAMGSGIMAVFVAGLVLGNGPLPYRSGLTRIHDAFAWMSQIGMFLMLGLLVFPSQLVEVALAGLGVGLALAFFARPAAVFLCLLPFRYDVKAMAGIGWTGLRGAVPIILATFPVLAGVEGAERIFNLVFFIVVVSSIVPGAAIRVVNRRLGLTVPERPKPAAVLEINATHPLNGDVTSFHIHPSLAVCGAKLSDIVMPADASVVLIVRGQQLIPARGMSVLQPGDHAYVFYHPEDRPYIELLFGGPEE